MNWKQWWGKKQKKYEKEALEAQKAEVEIAEKVRLSETISEKISEQAAREIASATTDSKENAVSKRKPTGSRVLTKAEKEIFGSIAQTKEVQEYLASMKIAL